MEEKWVAVYWNNLAEEEGISKVVGPYSFDDAWKLECEYDGPGRVTMEIFEEVIP